MNVLRWDTTRRICVATMHCCVEARYNAQRRHSVTASVARSRTQRTYAADSSIASCQAFAKVTQSNGPSYVIQLKGCFMPARMNQTTVVTEMRVWMILIIKQGRCHGRRLLSSCTIEASRFVSKCVNAPSNAVASMCDV